MAAAAPLVEPWEPQLDEGPQLGKLLLRLRPASTTGFRGVHKVNKKTFPARRTAGGKVQHVWTSDSARVCAYILAASDAGKLTVDEVQELRQQPSTSTDESTIETTIGTVDVSDVPERCDKLLAAGRYSDWYKLRSGLGLDTRLPLSPRKNV